MYIANEWCDSPCSKCTWRETKEEEFISLIIVVREKCVGFENVCIYARPEGTYIYEEWFGSIRLSGTKGIWLTVDSIVDCVVHHTDTSLVKDNLGDLIDRIHLFTRLWVWCSAHVIWCFQCSSEAGDVGWDSRLSICGRLASPITADNETLKLNQTLGKTVVGRVSWYHDWDDTLYKWGQKARNKPGFSQGRKNLCTSSGRKEIC